MRKTNLKLLVALIAAAVFMVGCGHSFVRDSFRTLSVSQQTYDTTMNTLVGLHRDGIIDDQDKAQIIQYGNLYYEAHNMAVVALANYAASDYQDPNAKQTYTNAAADVSAKLAMFLKMARPYLERGK